MSFRVLATPRSFCRVPGEHLSYLQAQGFTVDLRAKDEPLSAAELRALVPGYHGIILGLDACDASVLETADALRCIARNGAGVDTIDLDAATRRGVVVTNAPGANRVAVAELTLGLMLALARDLVAAASALKQGRYERKAGWELEGKTLGIVGLGAIGREVARRARCFGMRVLACDPYASSDDGTRLVALEALLREADVVSLHLPLTPETQGLISRERLALMRRGACLVNTARRELVDEGALYASLASGALAGAASDVSADRRHRQPLLALENFIATPHLGANTRESSAKANLMAAQNLAAVLRGGMCPFIVNPQALEVREAHER
jgi:D-3-phosphoglycerate dehydrogenase